MSEERTETVEFVGDRPKMISYFEHEAEIARSEIHSRRWMVAALVAFAAFVLSNACWIVYENQFEDVTVTQTGTSDGGGKVTLTGVGSGELNYYGDESDTDNQGQTP